MIIGITGGTGSGKTTLLKLLAENGFTVMDCDTIYHDLLKTDKNMLSAIEARFPGTVTDGVLNRKKLGNVVFSDPAALLALNAITHAAVKSEVIRILESTSDSVAIDAIGLFEGGLAELCRLTVAVSAPEELRVQRLMKRDGISESYARARIAAQRSQGEFEKLCDVTLVNDGTEEAFQEKCLAFLRQQGIMKV